MSHANETIICPNCGTEAGGNFCSQCGQETHLHKDTFMGLVMHFIGHYFHYDSKFWMTMRALITQPGKLTQAYIDRQRMRYIPPISLYIFISAVYFLISSMLHDGTIFPVKNDKTNLTHQIRRLADKMDSMSTDSRDSALTGNDGIKKKSQVHFFVDTGNDESLIKTHIDDGKVKPGKDIADTSNVVDNFFQGKMKKIEKEHEGRMKEYVEEKTAHTVPKIFFFMIPVLALLLKVMYRKRKAISFVDHTVFAIHYHSFWFSLWLIAKIGISNHILIITRLLFYITVFTYMVVAMRKIYAIGRGRAIANTVLVALGYGISFIIVSFLVSAILFVLA